MGKYLISLAGNEFSLQRHKDGERDVDCNMVTLKKASHYTTSDLPTIINGSWIKTVVRDVMI